MPSYVITGASRGLGFEFLRQLSADPANTVIGLSRNKAAAEENLKKAGIAERENAIMLEGDVGDLEGLKKAAAETEKITGGALDYLINNAAMVSSISGLKTIGDFFSDPATLQTDFLESFTTNALGPLQTIQAFLPLLRLSNIKKAINISTGMADIDMINDLDLAYAAPYSVSKAAANAVIAKLNAEFGKAEGILFLSISPGYVWTERQGEPPKPEDEENAKDLVGKFAAYAPHFTRPLTPEESVKAVLDVIEKASVENGDGGTFVSHLGNKQWL